MNIYRCSPKISALQHLKCYSSRVDKPLGKSYTDTILTPKSKFQPFPKSITQRDEYIMNKAKFLDCYEWQREHLKGEEFVLHDGPPYANGSPHMGHAINKIFKDIIVRSKLIQGRKVHFIPGWDCHGLPIELMALKDEKENLTPLEIRDKSRKLAMEKIEIQKKAFQEWGILGNWNEYYYTCNTDYVVKELELFWQLYDKGLIYYGFKPVNWSPSSRTALAEAELQYNDHVSPAVTVRCEIVNHSEPEPVYLVIWTTTPWTLPFNRAIYFTKKLQYSMVKMDSHPGNYIIANPLIENTAEKLKNKINIVRPVSHEELINMKYKQPWNKDEILRVFESSEVQEFATGLLHCAPAHGEMDFVLAKRNGYSVECFVDEKGCYTEEMGSDMCGLRVYDEGSSYVIKMLEKDILLKEDYLHRYPYDWRTNKPVITRCSRQWFIDTNKLQSIALECLSKIPEPERFLQMKLEGRPFWCISRQRVWGVPIPVFLDKRTNQPLISKDLVDHVCSVIKKHGTDSWWSLDIEELFPQKFCGVFNIKIEDVQRGNDILDIWFDSGVSWYSALEGKISDVCVEGVDQFRGWFQSSLLTSVAVRGKAPYKNLLVHGYAVDENGMKMSKSVGNVFDPNEVVKGNSALGADALRWWVASHGHHAKAPVSMSLLELEQKEILKLKAIFKFLLGTLNGYNADILRSITPLYYLDRKTLSDSLDVFNNIMDMYNNYNFQGVVSTLNYYVSNTVSANYISLVKDRLYCDELFSERRKSCVYTIDGILNTLLFCIAPILPVLAEEVYLCHPFDYEKSLFYSENMWKPPRTWEDKSVENTLRVADKIRSAVNLISQNSKEFSCVVTVDENDYDLLKVMQGGASCSSDSELTEYLQVASVSLKVGEENCTLEKANGQKCPRCRRFVAVDGELCSRCADVIGKINATKEKLSAST